MVNLTIGMVMISNGNECYVRFALIRTRFLVVAGINRQRKNVHGEKKAYHSHGAKLNKKNKKKHVIGLQDDLIVKNSSKNQTETLLFSKQDFPKCRSASYNGSLSE